MNNKDILRTKKKIIIFANTIWFLDKFKYELIEKLLNNYHIECLYLRNGPTFDTKRIDSLVNRGVILRRFSFGNKLISFFVFRILYKKVDPVLGQPIKKYTMCLYIYKISNKTFN